MNITPGGASVKPVFEVGAQGRQPRLTLGVIEIDDEQAGMRMDVQGCGQAVTAGMAGAEGGAALQEVAEPDGDRSLVREQAVHFPHPPDDAPAPLQAQVPVGVAPQQKQNGHALRRQGHEVDPVGGKGGVKGQDAGMAEEETVQNGLPAVRMTAGATADMFVVFRQFVQVPDGPHGRFSGPEDDPRAGVDQKEVPGIDTALRLAAAQPDLGKNAPANAHLHRGFIHPQDGFAVFDDRAPPALLFVTEPVQACAQLSPCRPALRYWGQRDRFGHEGTLLRH